MKWCIIIMVLCVAFAGNGCVSSKLTIKKGDGMQKEIDAITKVIHSNIGWAKNKDKEMLLSSMVQSDDLFILNPEEGSCVRGMPQFVSETVDIIFMNPKFKALSYEIKDLKITIAEKGNVAWYYCILNDYNEWDGHPANWENVRWTGVLEKQKGKWVIMQMHFSFGKKR